MSLVTGHTLSQVLVDCAAVHGYVKRVCFKTGPPQLVGTELEWLVAFTDDPTRLVPVELTRSVLAALPPPPYDSRITFEPGGQLELSSPPAHSASDCWRRLAADVAHVLRPLAETGLTLLPTAVDPHRPARRQLTDPRYAAMERYFAEIGAETGPAMMNSTAAVQVNLDIGADPADATRRWRLLHALGPILIAAFANSPVHEGRPTGWKSTRQHIWQRLDPSRTSPPYGDRPGDAWARYALDAPLMLVRRPGDDWDVAAPNTFRDWVSGSLDLAAPTCDDLAYHLSTLFPPVRPRGWYEIRYLDAQPTGLWPVPMAVLCGLVEDPVAAASALEAAAPVTEAFAAGGAWREAARDGMDRPEIAQAARDCFDIAWTALLRARTDSGLLTLVEQFTDRYVSHARCPADDVLEELT
jgi:glutamate--cysteine ligase